MLMLETFSVEDGETQPELNGAPVVAFSNTAVFAGEARTRPSLTRALTTEV
jgi:hypothetical protein